MKKTKAHLKAPNHDGVISELTLDEAEAVGGGIALAVANVAVATQAVAVAYVAVAAYAAAVVNVAAVANAVTFTSGTTPPNPA